MKILHIGKKGNMERFSAPDAPLYMDGNKICDMPMNLPAAEYIKAAGDAEHIIIDAIGDCRAELINGLPDLKSIHSEGVAFNRIDVEAASARGVIVAHSRGMNATAVAEQAILLMLGMLRNVAVNDRAVRDGVQIQAKEAYMINGNLTELADCSVGLVGFGDIARATAKLLTAFGVKNIYYYKRTPVSRELEEEYKVSFMALDELLAASDIVSLHVPVTPSTVKLADAEFFGKMKQGAYFVNTARGELVDDAALIDALRSGRLTMAGLDTLDNEPVSCEHPLLKAEAVSGRILFSPHIGGITASSFKRSYAMIWEDIETVRSGAVPKRAVNAR
ncbi:MAG: NAD(P)-dependent oxidoreductase [Eubacteriales bacterium]|nr:NAD(P)-dependent oxidoreductase [Eubacteriales bacterium]